jgi:hypothetical protein
MAFKKDEQPLLPVLKFQYKEFMRMSNGYAEANRSVQQKYWQALYKTLPGIIILPGQKELSMAKSCRDGEWAYYTVPEDLFSLLNGSSVRFNTSLFILLMATFKFYLYRITGQRDIVIGTMSFGRDRFDGLVDQIGYFAYTDLIRTVFDPLDEFEDAVEKVRKSNHDMKVNDVYTLMAHTVDMLPEGMGLTTSGFWRINLHYSDISGFYQDSDVVKKVNSSTIGIQALQTSGEIMETDLDIKIYFSNRRESLGISVHYDRDLYDKALIDELLIRYLDFIRETIGIPHQSKSK